MQGKRPVKRHSRLLASILNNSRPVVGHLGHPDVVYGVGDLEPLATPSTITMKGTFSAVSTHEILPAIPSSLFTRSPAF